MLKSDDLINKVKSYNKFLNPETLNKAYLFAIKAHENQKRDSGDPYVIHPVAVANILTELKLDSATIATGLLQRNESNPIFLVCIHFLYNSLVISSISLSESELVI